VGVDLEPLRPFDAGVVADSFDAEERRLLEDLGAGAGGPDAHALAWTAKEAIGKALGRGLPGGGRAVRLVECRPVEGGLDFVAELAGALADAFPERGRIRAHARRHAGHAVALCLLD
jgi:phosphopantetheinyl transferase